MYEPHLIMLNDVYVYYGAVSQMYYPVSSNNLKWMIWTIPHQFRSNPSSFTVKEIIITKFDTIFFLLFVFQKTKACDDSRYVNSQSIFRNFLLRDLSWNLHKEVYICW